MAAVLATFLVGAAHAAAQPAAGRAVTIAFDNGLVSLNARNVPVRAILDEWSRVGGVTIVNSERVPGGPVTLELTGVPERQALDIVLRGVSGYMVAQGSGRGAALSRFDRIYVVPTSVAAPPVRAAQAGRTTPSRARAAFPAERLEPESAEAEEQVPAEAIADTGGTAATTRGNRPAADAEQSAPPRSFGTWSDPAEEARRAAAATFGATTASRPGQATAAVPRPRPADAPPTPIDGRQQFDTRRGTQQVESYQQQLQQLQQQQQQRQQQPSAQPE